MAVVLGACCLAGVRLRHAFHALVLDPRAAVLHDLWDRCGEVARWIAGGSPYATSPRAMYPPASFPLLAPLLSFGRCADARPVWAVAQLVLVCGLAAWIARAARSVRVAALALGAVSLSWGIEVGQLHLVGLVPALFAIGLARRGTWAHDALAACLFTLAMAKPTVAAPFGWALLFSSGRSRPALLSAAGYLAATGVAALASPVGAVELFAAFFRKAQGGATWGAQHGGYGSIHDLLGMLGLSAWNTSATLVVLGLAGFVAMRARDPWSAAGNMGLLARFATYHRGYDDVLVLPAIAASWRSGARIVPGFAAVLLLVPDGGLPAPWLSGLRVASWLALLGQGIGRSSTERTSTSDGQNET